MLTPMRAVFVGDGSLVVRCVEAFARAGHAVVRVASADPQVLAWAQAEGFRVEPVQEVPRFEDDDFDLLFSIGWLHRLPTPLLARARRIALNYHDGPLPRHGGLHAPAWALLEGCRHHGITWHEMTAALDAGRIAAELSFDLSPDETAFSLATHCHEAGYQSFLTLVGQLADDALVLRAPAGPPRLHGRHDRPTDLGTLDWQRPASELAAMVRALDFGPLPNPLTCPKLWCEGRLLRLGGAHEVLQDAWLREVRDAGAWTDAPDAPDAPDATDATGAPGTVLAARDGLCWLRTGQGVLRLEGLEPIDGGPLPEGLAGGGAGAPQGLSLAPLPPSPRERLALATPALARAEAVWRERLLAMAEAARADLPHPRRLGGPALHPRSFEMALPTGPALRACPPHAWLAACAAWLGALSGEAAVALAWRDPSLAQASEGLSPYVSDWWPLLLSVGPDQDAGALRAAAQQVLAQAQASGPLCADLRHRLGRPAPAQPVLGIFWGEMPTGPAFDAPEVCLLIPTEPAPAGAELSPWRLRFDARAWSVEVATEITAQLAAWLDRFQAHAGALSQLPLITAQDRARLAALNDTAKPVDLAAGVWPVIAQALQRQPEAIALAWDGGEMTRSELHAQVHALAADLHRRGLQRGEVVGVCLPRGPALVVSVLAVLAGGGAYLPLDPHYPAERLRFMCRDAGVQRVLGGPEVAALLGLPPQAVVSPDPRAQVTRDMPIGAHAAAPSDMHCDGQTGAAPPQPQPQPGELAYRIYTSGSTGQPKGVEVTQGGVLNFFAGMDAVLAPPPESPGRWLAITSLSFDISVLELLWTLARGFTVVVHGAVPEARPVDLPAAPTVATAPPNFSLFYFASEGEGAEGDAYRLLLEGARFADAHGFAAVWTPERHFHGFGGPFPNPALAAAALAMVTERVQLRAGSCVLPLHHPLSVAEDWALVDRLSGGRVGVSFAAGWQPQDFVLAPQAWAGRREQLFAGIEAVRRLWRGEAMDFPGPEGRTVSVRTRPRPLQPELPVWVTAAGKPQTFAEAGRAGCHLLTHLLGQSVQALGPKIAAYRAAWQAAGHPGRGQVALMLHTLVGDDEAAVREAARGPLKAYLRSAMDLIARADWRFPTFGPGAASTSSQAGAASEPTDGGLADLAEAPPTACETEALLEHAFERYWRGSALVGAPARCLALVDQLHAQGVDEIACLIDFGVDADAVLARLPDLHRLMQSAQRGARSAPDAATRLATPRALSVPAAITQGRITHLQCTPSQAAILLADEAGRQALSRLSVLLVGGEALPPAMARALRELVPGSVLNMYGPTEATVWCSCGPLPARAAKGPAMSAASPEDDTLVSLGRPLANVSLHLRTAWGQECPAYVPGELWVGGAGLARGYHARPALDAERFIDDPLQPGRRLYRTGDQVRRLPDGRLQFLGRSDHQVKIRGHRIELGEIEAVLARQPGVREAVVVACQPGGAAGAGEAWLQAFVTARPGQAPQPLALARTLAGLLPEFMLPRGIALRERLPTTPNGKVDRQALASAAEAPGNRQEREAREARDMRERHEARDKPPRHLAASTSQAEGGPQRFEPLVDAVWRGVLGRQEIAREANFFDLGGHSLAVVQVQRRLREATGIEIAITDMFRLTTVAAQARHLARGPSSSPAAIPASLGQDRALARRALRARVPG